jgi:hypothetical protein
VQIPNSSSKSFPTLHCTAADPEIISARRPQTHPNCSSSRNSFSFSLFSLDSSSKQRERELLLWELGEHSQEEESYIRVYLLIDSVVLDAFLFCQITYNIASLTGFWMVMFVDVRFFLFWFLGSVH